MDFTALDFETEPVANGVHNEPWQLGVVRVRRGEIVETREFFFRERSLLDSFPDWSPLLVRERLVAHNIACERTILTRTAPLTKWGPWVDTMKLAKARFPRLKSFALGDVCAALGCVPQMEGRTWHDALYDAVACASLALRLGNALMF